MNANILLPQVYKIENPQDFKVHMACLNQENNQPLDIFVRDRTEWRGWSEWGNKINVFNRRYIFTLIDYYPQRDTWLFGGAYEVLSRTGKVGAKAYSLRDLEESMPYVGRLKLSFKRPGRAKHLKLENYYNSLVVSEILSEPYSGEVFPGYDRIELSFTMLENLIQRQKADWKAALGNAKGVYLITDERTGKRYVGSAYGNIGLWSRWECYAGTAHGHSDEMTKLIRKEGLDYARKHFRFSLLEYFSMKTEKNLVCDREAYWKRVLMTRAPFGYNKN